MIKIFLCISLIITGAKVQSQNETSGNGLLAEAYRLQNESLRDSAIIYFQSAAIAFKKKENWGKYIECLAGQNRNYLKTDQIGNLADNGLEALEVLDAGKASEKDEYVIEILTQLSRFNWYAKGNFPESLKYLDRAIKICEGADFDVSGQKVQIFTEYGYTYGYSGDFNNSEKYFKDALDLALQIYGDDSEVVADRYTDIVFPLIQKSEWEKAEVALKKATELNIRLRGPDHISVLKNYNNLGYIYLEKFDNDQAILYINRAIEMIRERFGEDHRSIGIGYMNLGASYHNKNEYRNSIIYSLKAYENFKVTIGAKNPYMGIVLLNTGNAYTYLNIPDSAIYYFDKALSLKKELYGEYHLEVVRTYGYMSHFFIENEMYDEAHRVITRAIEISNEILPKKHELSANNHLYMSQYYAAIGKYDESLQEVQQALIGLVFDFDDPSIKANPVLKDNIISTRILIDALVHKTKVLMKSSHENGDPELLHTASETALVTSQAIDILRIEYQTPEGKELLVSRSKEFYEDAIEISLLQYEKNGDEQFLDLAFQYMEKCKSILLVENVRLKNEVTFSDLPDSISNEENSLSRSITLLKEQIFEAQNQEDSATLVRLEEEFFRKKRDYDLLLNYIEQEHPDYFSVQHSIFKASIEAARGTLSDGELMVSYFAGKQYLFAFGISQDTVTYQKIDLSNQLLDSIQNLVSSFEGRQFNPALSQNVYSRILEPILKYSEKAKTIVLIPDGLLHYLPFEAFVINSSEAGSSKYQYLIEDFTVYYMHTTSVTEKVAKPAADELAYIGFSPTYNVQSNPLLASRSARNAQIASQLEKLPMAEQEVEASARIWNGEYLVSEEATEQTFRQKAKYAKIIHIASHAIIDDQEPLKSKLVFSPGADSVEDGLLHTYELYNMRLNAQLACLSACNTGFGQIRSGEGVVSLAKGFFYAGVPSVLMSLWSVPDISTSEIMTTFYKELKQGIGKADALRNAKLTYLEQADQNTSDPYYWAAFAMIGDNLPVEHKTPLSKWIWTVAIFTLFGITYLWVKRNRIKK